MRILVDANVLSEATRSDPHPAVIGWLREHERMIVIDPIILGEIRFGINLLPKGRKRSSLETWFDQGVARIVCLTWDAATGIRWAALLADLRREGLAMPLKDSMIGATALHNGLPVATRNTGDFRKVGVEVINPFG